MGGYTTYKSVTDAIKQKALRDQMLARIRAYTASLSPMLIEDQGTGSWPDNDWFGWFGGLFEENYNGGVVYDGDAWYGTNFIGPGPSADPYTLKDRKNPGQFLRPKDMVDEAAQLHDSFYHTLHADGVTGALFATRVAFADRILANQAAKAFFGYFRGDIDPVTGNAISPRTRDVAFDIMVSFGLIGGAKSGHP